jgi:hypothetical protein
LMLVTVGEEDWQTKLKLACVEATEFGAVTCTASQNVVPLPHTDPSCQVVVTACVVTPGLKVTVWEEPVAPSERNQWYVTVPPGVPAGTVIIAVKVKVMVLLQTP